MTSLLSQNPALNPNRSSSSRSSTTRRTKKKIMNKRGYHQSHDIINNPIMNGPDEPIEWRSDAQQQIYSSKLLQALHQVRLGGGGGATAGPRRVHEAADRVLAATAKGRSRWSRAILKNTNRLKVKYLKKRNTIAKRESKIISVVTGNGNSRLKKNKKFGGVLRLKSKSLPAVHRKVKVLGRLVPGCRKQPLPVVLEEATDYIAALEMQVRAMSALAELLSISGSSSAASGSSTGINEPGSNPSPPN